MNKWKDPAKILESLLDRKNFFLKDKAEEIWKNIPGVSGKGELTTIENSKLLIKAKNSIYLQELSFRKEEILEAFEKTIPGRIKSIRFSLGG